ncbi:slipin family protein [Mameliella alba]|nr:slipin family protein [Antarctobacter heliothermus]MBY6146598.1 slipin family protein [Mameliella alba]MCA0956260.1 slipin family protein [Mameliella alba]
MTNVLTRLFHALAGRERVTLSENERLLVLVNGRFDALLGPGEHLFQRDGSRREVHNIDGLRFISGFDRALFRSRPDLVADHLTEVRTGSGEIAVIMRDGRPIEVLMPEDRVVFWTDAGPFTVERFDLATDARVEPQFARRLERAGLGRVLTTLHVGEGQVGMLFLDGVLSGRMAPGVHSFWAAGPRATVRIVDMRQRAHEVVGQEILTKDRVTIRVNLTAIFRVKDPERAVTAVTDFEEALHRAVQLLFRRRLGVLTLDQLLAGKGAIDVEAGETLRADLANIGIDVQEIALKDVILPGEIREILNRVVEAEKEAEANVILRREETNAMRSLLNTAKVMEDNPVMLRLKELDALETIAAKVDHLTVHNGTQGLLQDIARLRD